MEVPENQSKKVMHVREWMSDRIRQVRIARGLTQTQLADKMEVHLSRVSDLERNVSDYKFSTVCRAALALGVTLDQIARGVPAWSRKNDETMLVLTPAKLFDFLVEGGLTTQKSRAILKKIEASLQEEAI